ncbi:MAG TPA: hypothetical protein VHB21_00675, partial [Minicystis sp.]|nr:hypothetical protein [Minicystis sp.]
MSVEASGAAAASPAPRPARRDARKKPVSTVALVLAAGAVGAAATAVVGYVRERPGKGVEERAFAGGTREPWIERGFVEMVPTLRLPTRVDGRSRIEVWLRVPEGAKLGARAVEGQKRTTLVYPPGTIADRIELVDDRIVDV